MVWGIPSVFFFRIFVHQPNSQKMQETNGEALLYFCQQARFWGRLLAVGRFRGGFLGAEEQLDRKGIFLSPILRIHVKFPGSFSVVFVR